MKRSIPGFRSDRRARFPSAEALEPRRLMSAVAWGGSYGDDGRTIVDLDSRPRSDEYVGDAAVQQDGKLIIATSARDRADQVIRLDTAGHLDTTFGIGGVIELPRGNVSPDCQVLPLPDGRLLVAVNTRRTVPVNTPFPGTSDQYEASIYRFNADGSLDSNFGYGQYGGIDLPNLIIQDLAPQPGGGILISGATATTRNFSVHTQPVVMRMDTNGKFDRGFNANIPPPVDDYQLNSLGSLAVRADGSFVGLTREGWLGFAADGSFLLGPIALQQYAPSTAIAIGTGGEVLGVRRAYLEGQQGIIVSRWNADGTLDQSFGDQGTSLVNWGAFDAPAALVTLPDGKIIAGATTGYDFSLARLLPDGSLDPTFGVDGKLAYDVSGNSTDALQHLLLGRNDQLLAIGSTSAAATGQPGGPEQGLSNIASVRFLLDPPLIADPGGPYGPVSEGSTFAVMAQSHPPTEGVRYEWDDTYFGRSFHTVAEGQSVVLRAGDDHSPYFPALRVTAPDGLQTVSKVPVEILNVPPQVQIVSANRFAVVNGNYEVSLKIDDPGIGESFTLVSDWGDGTQSRYDSIRDSHVTLAHRYTSSGTFGPVTVTVTDNGGASAAASAAEPVTVNQIAGRIAITGAAPPGVEANRGVTVYVDLDQDHEPDANEPQTLTDTLGEFRFAGLDLPAGQYLVRMVTPADWLPGPYGDTAYFSTGQAGGGFINFSITQVSRIRGFIYNDTNANGLFDPDEYLITRGLVYLDLNDNGQADPEEPSASGEEYVFEVAPGEYTVRLEAPRFLYTNPSTGARRVTIGQAAEVRLDFGTVRVIDGLPPVLGVWVKGSAWTDEFLDDLQVRGLGDSKFGYRLPLDGSAPVLPWTNIDQITVSLDGFHLQSVQVLTDGSEAQQVVLQSDTDSSLNYAHVHWAKGAVPSKLVLGLPGAVSLVLPLNIVRGDVSRDAQLTSFDRDLIRYGLGSRARNHSDPYTPFADLNGDGVIDTVDVRIARASEPFRPAPARRLFSPTRIVLPSKDDEETPVERR